MGLFSKEKQPDPLGEYDNLLFVPYDKRVKNVQVVHLDGVERLIVTLEDIPNAPAVVLLNVDVQR